MKITENNLVNMLSEMISRRLNEVSLETKKEYYFLDDVISSIISKKKYAAKANLPEGSEDFFENVDDLIPTLEDLKRKISEKLNDAGPIQFYRNEDHWMIDENGEIKCSFNPDYRPYGEEELPRINFTEEVDLAIDTVNDELYELSENGQIPYQVEIQKDASDVIVTVELPWDLFGILKAIDQAMESLL